MDISEAFELLDYYNLRKDAENECKRRKLDVAPYDMMGHHKDFAIFLEKQWLKLRNKNQKLQSLECLN